MKTGLVLEGGAMRGMYTAGVLDVFMEHGLLFDGIIGVSAGALFGVNYLSGQKGRVIRYNKRYNADKNYLGLRPLLRTGNIVDTEYAYHRVPCELDVFDDAAYRSLQTWRRRCRSTYRSKVCLSRWMCCARPAQCRLSPDR